MTMYLYLRAIRGDVAEGPNRPLLDATGYVPAAERRWGLTRSETTHGNGNDGIQPHA
jgi:hypothetical protein